MSTYYSPLQKIRFLDLFDGRLERSGVREDVNEETDLTSKRCLTDGRNYLWVYKNDDDEFVGDFTRYGLGNVPGKILGAIAEALDTEIVSEYEPQFWGFETQEEWDSFQQKMADEGEAKFYEDLMKFVRGETNDLRPGTIGMIQADIAKDLIAESPHLALPKNKTGLLQAVKAADERDHTMKITLDENDVAFAIMLATHEDDLPRA